LKLISPSDWDNPRLPWNTLPEKRFLINHQNRIIYCPIHKVASTTLKLQLILTNNPNVVFDVNKDRPSEAKYCCSLATYSFEEANKLLQDSRYLKVVFVRNPWERLTSAYLNRIVTKGNLSGIVLTAYKDKALPSNYLKSITFRQFIDYIMVTDDNDLNIHWQPQYLYLGNQHFDFIGRYENLATDFERLKQMTQLPSILIKENATQYCPQAINSDKKFCDYSPNELRQLAGGFPSYEYFYPPDLIECVIKRYQKDVEMFGYSFNN
ncbi:MAG: sulfotransferase family protein, partial [Candidatus Parabeggiatoa sp.]|nr:sulfotransferase family protein [Candidatus Parabeggiatoa sp.]